MSAESLKRDLINILPKVLSADFQTIWDNEDGRAYMYTNSYYPTKQIAIIISINIETDGKRWIHLSASRKKQLPSWMDLKEIKQIFLQDRKAIQVLPQKDRYVNINPYVLHLFTCLDGDGLPEFSGFRQDYKQGTIRTL